MQIDIGTDIEKEMESEAGEFGAETDRETRCYAISGNAATLDSLEALLRRIEWVGECGATSVVCALVEGRRGARITARALASWLEMREEAESGGAAGTPLPRLMNESVVAPCYVIDIGA